jgi:hypothetical protein
MERIRWDVQEDWVYVRRAYEKVQGSEDAAAYAENDPNGAPYMGAVLAAYRVETHFDLKRAYNPSTGEEYNVLEENTSDNPWYDREYMRIDWSKNYATQFQFMVDDVQQDGVAYYVQDPSDPDYPVFDAGRFDADGKMVRAPYIDVTNTVINKPGMTYFPEYDESYPTCWLFSRATADCTAEIVKVRNSFLRVDPNNEYVPKKFKGTITDFFGLFTQDRLVYDPLRDVNERKRERYANLHNIWNDWIDDNGELIADPANRGGVRPMIYYVHDWPEAAMPALRKTEAEWDAIFQRAVSGAIGEDYTGRVFVACNWPLVEGEDDPEVCVPAEYLLEDGSIDPAFNPRLGDVRYNWIAYVDKWYDGFALLGLGPTNSDPLTGESISAGAYMYVYNDIVTQSTTDQIRLLNNQMDPTDYINGVDLEDWMDQAPARMEEARSRTVAPATVRAMADAQNFDWAKGLVGGPTQASDWAAFEGRPMREVLKEVMPIAREAGMFNPDFDDSDGRLQQLQGTYIEKLLLNDEIQLAAGIMPGSSFLELQEEQLRNASVVRIGPIKLAERLEGQKQYLANVKNLDLMNTADDGYIGLANKFAGMTETEIFEHIEDDVFHAVLAHELGHSFNLHHNFGGTEDVLNYKDEYWVLRTMDGTVGPRFEDPITDEELDGQIYSYAYSSIMDYSRLTLDGFGPGKYDEAAILLGYGDVVEVYDNTGGAPINNFHDWATSDGGILIFFFAGPEAYHYTQWYADMGDDLYLAENRELVPASEINWEDGSDTDGRPRVPYIYCSPYQSDIGNGCFTRDYGADEYERMQHHISIANTWYISRSFTRFAVGASPEDYIGRTYGRTYRRMKGYNDYYALIVGILTSLDLWTDEQITTFLTDPDLGWGSYTVAEHDNLQFLLETIMRPDIDAYAMQTDGAGEQYMMSSATGQGLRAGLNSGRFFTTAWWDANGDDNCGMYWWECLHHYGFYLDKVMALTALTDSNTYFVARDTAEDIRQWRINFYDNFGPQLNNFLGGVLALDYSEIGPGLTGGDNLHFPDYVLGTAKSAGQTVNPAAGFTVQLYAAVLGMARLQNNFDRSFLDSSRMWLEGSSFGVNAPTCEFDAPTELGWKRYRAIAMPDDMGVAQRMIVRANAAKARMVDTTLTEAERNRAKSDLVRYMDLLDIMVDLTGYYETHTQGYGDPYNPGEVP